MDNKSYLRRLALNSQIFKSSYFVLLVDDKGHENYLPVGRGVKSSSMCGKWTHLNLCRNVEGHAGLSLNGEDATGQGVVHHSHLFCNRALCPVCFIRGYSVRRARSVTSRLEEGVRRGLGVEVEHVMVSISPSDYALEEDVLRVKARSILKSLGVSGSSMIFHGFRVDKKRQVLAWGAHYHAFSYVGKSGYECRLCARKSNCSKDCDGFDARAWKSFQSNNYYVKVFSERAKSRYDGEKKNVFGSVFYALNHATKRIGIKGSHIVTYFGVVANRKFATPKVVSEVKCPLCNEVMVSSVYVGSCPFVKELGDPNYKPVVLRPLFNENGESNFIDKE